MYPYLALMPTKIAQDTLLSFQQKQENGVKISDQVKPCCIAAFPFFHACLLFYVCE